MLKNSGRGERHAVDCLDKLHALASRDKRKRLAINDRRKPFPTHFPSFSGCKGRNMSVFRLT